MRFVLLLLVALSLTLTWQATATTAEKDDRLSTTKNNQPASKQPGT